MEVSYLGEVKIDGQILVFILDREVVVASVIDRAFSK